MIERLRNRITQSEIEGGFTLIELLVVIIIIGILLAIAVPSYLGFKQRATDSSLKSDLRAAMPSAEAFYSDNTTYAGMTATTLKNSYDKGISPYVTVYAAGTNATQYCLTATDGSTTWSIQGPGANTQTGFKGNGTCT